MKPSRISIALLVVSLFFAPALFAQSPDAANQSVAAAPAPTASAAEVPRLIKFSGSLLDEQGRALAGPAGVTFALYARQTGGAALWVETQNVKPDSNGAYTVLLGAASANGVPAELFVSGEARWLGIQVEQQPEHERILLVSVPYALKAGDAETLGGKPVSSFVLNEASATGSSAGSAAVATSSAAGKTQTTAEARTKSSATPQAATPCSSVTSDGTAATNSIGLFTARCNIASSLMSQATVNGFLGINLVGNNAGLLMSGTGTHEVTVAGSSSSGRLGQDAQGFFFASDTNGKSVRFLTNNGTLNEWMRITSAGNVGIGTAAPAFNLDVNGLANFAATNNSQILSVNQNGSGVAIFAATPSSVGTAILGRANAGNASGSAAVTGINSATSGIAFGVTGEVSSPAGIAGLFDNHGGGLILSGQANGIPKFTVDGSGSITASSFTGSGAGVTNVNAAMLGGLAPSAFAQLGTNNTFTGGINASGFGITSGGSITTPDGVNVVLAAPNGNLVLQPNGNLVLQPVSTSAQTVQTSSRIRMGSETTAEGPVVSNPFFPGANFYFGMVLRRINSTATTAGSVVAKTDKMALQRDGSAAGFQISVAAATGHFSIACLGLTSTTTVLGFTDSFVNPSATVAQVFNQTDLQQFNCSFGNTDEGHMTEVNLIRYPTGSTWVGTVTSTYNQ